MNALKVLEKYVGRFQGEGINHEGEKFVGTISLEKILSGLGFQLKFEAKSVNKEAAIFHAEVSTIAPNAAGGISLYNLNTNMPFLCEHQMVSEEIKEDSQVFLFRFGDIENGSSFREEIRLECFSSGEIGYHYSWGMPDGGFAHRSGIKAQRINDE